MTTILETELDDDWLVEEIEPRSNPEDVGDVRLCVDNEGEKAPDRVLILGPPPPLPPPPPRDTVVGPAAEDAKFDVENGVLARDRGDVRIELDAGICCTAPA